MFIQEVGVGGNTDYFYLKLINYVIKKDTTSPAPGR